MNKTHVTTQSGDVVRLLLQEGTWSIVTCDGLQGYEPLLQSWITHNCQGNGEGRDAGCWWNLAIINRKCKGCNEYPPSHLMGLWRLHNWQFVQAGDEYV